MYYPMLHSQHQWLGHRLYQRCQTEASYDTHAIDYTHTQGLALVVSQYKYCTIAVQMLLQFFDAE